MFLLSLRIWSLLLSLLTLVTAIFSFTHPILWIRIWSPRKSCSKDKLAKVPILSVWEGHSSCWASSSFFLLHVHVVCCGRISLAILLLIMLNPKMSILKLSTWSPSLSWLCHPSQLAKSLRLSFGASFSCSIEPPKSPSNPSTSLILFNHPYLRHLPTPFLLRLFCLPQLPSQPNLLLTLNPLLRLSTYSYLQHLLFLFIILLLRPYPNQNQFQASPSVSLLPF